MSGTPRAESARGGASGDAAAASGGAAGENASESNKGKLKFSLRPATKNKLLLWLEEKNGVYVLPAYVAPARLLSQPSSGFGRQGR